MRGALWGLFFVIAGLLLAGCTVEETGIPCINNDDCLISEYCYIDGTMLDEYGDPIGECYAAVACTEGTCDSGYDCIDGFCKPGGTPQQDYDYPKDDFVPVDDTPVVTDDAPVVTDDAPVVTDDAPVVTDDDSLLTDDAPVVTDDAPVVTDDAPVVTDDDSLLTDEEQPDTVDVDIAPDTDTPPATFTAEFTDPGDGATTNLIRPDLIITFSQPVDDSTLVYDTGGCDGTYESVITITPTIGIDVDNSVLSGGGTVLTVKLLNDLADGTTYTITVPNDIQSTGGTYLAQTYSWTLKTDFSKPTGLLTIPGPVTGVAVDTNIEVTFSKAMDTTTVDLGTTLTIVGSGGAPAVTGTPVWSASDTIWTLDPDSDLATDTTYTVTLTTGIADTIGSTMNEAIFAFTTTDTIAPTVLSTDPVDGADPTPITLSAVTVSFSEKVINVDETTMTMEKTSDATPIIGTVSLSTDGLTASFVPAAPLEDSTEYTVTLNPDGVTPVIADPEGNPLTGNSDTRYVFGFTTGASICNDGQKTGAEACDDGNNDDGDYCAADCSATTQPINKVVTTYLGDINTNGWTPGTSICPGYTDVSGKKCSPSDYIETNTDYTVNARKAYVYFDSDSGTHKSGFEILRNGQVIIKYPDSGTYAADTERLWVLDSNNNIGLITLRILADGIEYHSSCGYDYVRISACPNFTHGTVPATCNLEARYQGTTVPATAVYPTNRIRTRFLSDEATVYNGFQMTVNGAAYQTTPYNNYANNMDQYLDITVDTPPATVIFQNFETEMGGYSSSDYPGDYMYLYSCPLEQ